MLELAARCEFCGIMDCFLISADSIAFIIVTRLVFLFALVVPMLCRLTRRAPSQRFWYDVATMDSVEYK